MRWFVTAVVSLAFLISAHGLELLRSRFQLQDGHKVIYRFETQDLAVVGTPGRVEVNKDEVEKIAIAWAASFYGTSGLVPMGVRFRITPIRFWQLSLTGRSDHQTVYAVVLANGSIVEPVEDTVPDEDLLTLARLKFTEFCSTDERSAFEKFVQKTQAGEQADFTPELKTVTDPRHVQILTDPVYAELWAKDRVLRAEWLIWLCKDPKASALVTSRGIDIAGARVDGALDLAWAKIPFPLQTSGCAFTKNIILDQSSIRCLKLQATAIKGLQADGLNVERDVLFTGGFRATGTVWLRNATISGTLDCNGGHFDRGEAGGLDERLPPSLYLEQAKIGGGVYLENAELKGVVQLKDAEIGGDLDCEGAHFDGSAGLPGQADNALFAPSMKVTGNARFNRSWGSFNDFDANGQMVLRNATIGGNLDCYGGHFSNPGSIAIDALSVKVGADIWLRFGFNSIGEIRLNNATIGGNLDCNGGQFDNAGHNALSLNSANIQGSVLLGTYKEDDERARGFVRTRKNSVKKEVIDFAVKGNIVFLAATIGGVFELDCSKPLENTILDLQDAKAGTLFNGVNKNGWPKTGHLLLHGFVYNVIDNRGKLEALPQLGWLRLQPAFFAQPYEQMSAVLRAMGLQNEATEVMIGKNRDHGVNPLRVNEFLWYGVFGPFIGFGYRPWNAFYASLFVVALGYLLFRAGEGCKILTPTTRDAFVDPKSEQLQLSDYYPRFNAFIYSLENFVPFLKLNMSEYWSPNATRFDRLRIVDFLPMKVLRAVLPKKIMDTLLSIEKRFNILERHVPINGRRLRLYLWFHITAGWVLTTLWVGGLTGLIKS
jgi:hypothetical protein